MWGHTDVVTVHRTGEAGRGRKKLNKSLKETEETIKANND
jgi:hypothetical protein